MLGNKPFSEIFQQKSLPVVQKDDETDTLSVKAGRQSLPTDINTVGGLIAALGVSMPDFNYKLLEALETLSIYNSEVSEAVDNIMTLGNTIETFPRVAFGDDATDEQSKEMIKFLKERSKKYYSYSAGLNSLVNDLFGQIAINGALSAEICPNRSLDGVDRVILLAPKHIRFKYDNALADYKVYQEVQNALGLSSAIDGNLNPLNTVTYKYMTLRRLGEKPYGIPPFLSALENIAISRDMAQNLMAVVKKLGILGFLEVLIKAPKPNQGETDVEYWTRGEKYLNMVIPEIDKGLAKGYVAGFDGMHQFNMHPSNTNVTGAKDLVEMNDVKLMSGLKQDPIMFGRNFSTTESLARVVLAKMTTQVGNYQTIVASFLESLFLMDLQLAGYSIKTIEVTFDKPMIGDELKKQQAREKEIANVNALYQNGTISQQQRAIELGYEKPDQEEPRAALGILDPNTDPADGGDGKDPSKSEEDTTKKKAESNSLSFGQATSIDVDTAAASLGKFYPEYEYHTEGCTCSSHEIVAYASGNKSLDKFIQSYLSNTTAQYRKATASILAKLVKNFANFTDGGGEQAIIDSVLTLIYREWQGQFTIPQTKIINQFVKSIYTYFRKDTAIFGGKDGIPNGAFSTVDFRALDYYKASDTFYLGKFITDDDLKKNITEYIKEAYLDQRLPIGNDPKGIAVFKKEFGDLFAGQDWKLRRVIDTTVAKMRNTAAASYMQQAEVESFEIAGVNDRLQCAYCASMQGKVFSVTKSMEAINGMVQSDPAIVSVVSPFVTSLFKKAEDMANLTGAQLQDAGLVTPPFHSLCRDTIIAII